LPAIFKPNLIIQKKPLKYYTVFGISCKLLFSLNLYFLYAVNIESKIKTFNKTHSFDTLTKLSASKLRASGKNIFEIASRDFP